MSSKTTLIYFWCTTHKHKAKSKSKTTSSFLPDAAPDVMMLVSDFWSDLVSALRSSVTNNLASQSPFTFLSSFNSPLS